VQLVLDLPENQPHRADVSKMLVHRRARRRGLGAALDARRRGACPRRRPLAPRARHREPRRRAARTHGSAGSSVGVIPRYALLPSGEPCATSYFYRDLEAT
jgi:hypothetical protein